MEMKKFLFWTMEVYQLKSLGHQWDVIENNIYSGNLPKCILQKIFTCTYENQTIYFFNQSNSYYDKVCFKIWLFQIFNPSVVL
jgi:hypothetical protein